jgi:hypothetical protein
MHNAHAPGRNGFKACSSRDEALALGYRQGSWTLARLAEQSGLSLSHMRRLIAGAEGRKG